MLQDEIEVKSDESENHRRNEKYVDGEEAAQRRAADGLAAENEACQVLAHEGRPPCLLGAHDDGPRRVLVPAEELPSKSHPQREHQEKDAGQPVHLAGELERSGEEHLRHVKADHEHHGGSTVVMETAQESPERRVVGDEDQCLVRL